MGLFDFIKKIIPAPIQELAKKISQPVSTLGQKISSGVNFLGQKLITPLISPLFGGINKLFELKKKFENLPYVGPILGEIKKQFPSLKMVDEAEDIFNSIQAGDYSGAGLKLGKSKLKTVIWDRLPPGVKSVIDKAVKFEKGFEKIEKTIDDPIKTLPQIIGREGEILKK